MNRRLSQLLYWLMIEKIRINGKQNLYLLEEREYECTSSCSEWHIYPTIYEAFAVNDGLKRSLIDQIATPLIK